METVVGRRVLGEVEEMSLEEVLQDFRAAVAQTTVTNDTTTAPLHPVINRRLKQTSISSLDRLVVRRAATTQTTHISIAGRHLPLLYALVTTLVSAPHYRTILIVDFDARFDPTRLACTPEDLRHVYIQRAARRCSPEAVRALVDEAGSWMLYGAHRASAGREWWGTVVVGGSGAPGDISASWRGWLRVDRASVGGFAVGLSAEEALDQRAARQEVVDRAGWTASSAWGGFVFFEDGTEGGG